MSFKRAIFVGFLALAYSSWPGKDDSNKLVPLSQILETRAVREDMVPQSAAQDEDFIRFITALRSRTANGTVRPIARIFETETQTSGLNAYEMYGRIQNMLSSLNSDIEFLQGSVQETELGQGYSTNQLCTNLHICLGLGIRVGLGVGFERRGKWILPVFSLRGAGTCWKEGGPAIGAFADVGVESRQSADKPRIGEVMGGTVGGGALVLGAMESGDTATGQKYRAFATGIGIQHSEVGGYQIRLPLFFPIPTGNPNTKALRLMGQLAQEIQHFNLAKAALLTQALRNEVKKIKASYRRRTGQDLQSYSLVYGHPFLSPGAMFSGSALVLYSPDLVPDLVEIYKAQNRGKKAKPCEAAVIDVEPARLASPVQAKALPQ